MSRKERKARFSASVGFRCVLTVEWLGIEEESVIKLWTKSTLIGQLNQEMLAIALSAKSEYKRMRDAII